MGDFNSDGFGYRSGNGLWINKGNDNNWLKINTVGKQSNINGIGARVEIYGAWGRQIREVRSGQSFAPMSSLQIHFGIGQADAIDKVVVKWPSGAVTTVNNPTINTTITVQEIGCLLPPTNLIVNGSTAICPGDSVVLSAPKGFSYAWSNGDSTQTLTVTRS
ncbi:MAG: ASPIC/UnbV domain-containing protein [Saprospiraceae bacterium]